jgi:hypothetical protein
MKAEELNKLEQTVVDAIVAAEKRGHRFTPFKQCSMGDDTRYSWACTRCGDKVIAIYQGRRPVEVNGLAADLGRCHADRKGDSK